MSLCQCIWGPQAVPLFCASLIMWCRTGAWVHCTFAHQIAQTQWESSSIYRLPGESIWLDKIKCGQGDRTMWYKLSCHNPSLGGVERSSQRKGIRKMPPKEANPLHFVSVSLGVWRPELLSKHWGLNGIHRENHPFHCTGLLPLIM